MKVKLAKLIEPYGGQLVDLIVTEEKRDELKQRAGELPSIQISERADCDLELLACGAFSPLDRFMGKADLDRVVGEMRLSSGRLCPLPIVLPVNDSSTLKLDSELTLRNSKNELLGIMRVEEIFGWNLKEIAMECLGTQDLRHPLVAEMHSWGKYFVSGQLRIIESARHHDFKDLRMTPSQTRAQLENRGKANVVAFQTRNPLHRVHEELTKRAIQEKDAVLLLHPVVGMTKPGDVDHYTRVRTYRTLAANYYSPDSLLLALLPLAMQLAGPREALWHALIRRNYGANHLIIGRDHAGPGKDSSGRPFYDPYAAQEIVQSHRDELGVAVIPFKQLVYLPDQDQYEEVSNLKPDAKTAQISGTEVREEYLNRGRSLPQWFTRPEVAEILSETYPARHRQGICVWFTGFSGSGKSTTAEVFTSMLLEHGRQVTVLDGDVVRTNLSKGLGFSREDRDINIRRIGFVAAELVRHGGLVVCAAVSPYRATRNDVRNRVGDSHFVEVFVDTPLEVCEARDVKGMYAKARRGEIREFTGIDDPYEAPENPEIVLDTVEHTPEENARSILDYLVAEGFVRKLDAPT